MRILNMSSKIIYRLCEGNSNAKRLATPFYEAGGVGGEGVAEEQMCPQS
jgi:hypothetical protein